MHHEDSGLVARVTKENQGGEVVLKEKIVLLIKNNPKDGVKMDGRRYLLTCYSFFMSVRSGMRHNRTISRVLAHAPKKNKRRRQRATEIKA